MNNYNKSVLSPCDPTKLAIHSILRPEDDLISNCGPNLKKTVSLDDVVHFIDEENMVTYVDFDCGLTFFPETPTKIKQIKRERNYLSRSCEKPQCIRSNDQQNCFVDEQHSSNIFPNPYNLWDMVPAALMSLSHTNDTYSMLNQYPQPTTQQPRADSARCSLHYERWTVTRRDCASALHSFKEITYRTDEWTKQLLRLKSWMISGSRQQWMELHRLWWTVIVFKCSYLFHLFGFCCLAGAKLVVFLENLPFLIPFFDDFEWAVKIHRHFLCKVTLL